VLHLRHRCHAIVRVSVVALAAVAPIRSAIAQNVLDASSAAHVRAMYLTDLDTLHAKVLALANAIPAERYAWRPTAGVRSVSEVLMHIASEWSFYAPRSVGGKEPPDFGVPREKLAALEKITAKSEVIDQLEKAWTYGRAQVAAADPAQLTGKYKPWGIPLDQAAFSMTDDLHEHLGQLIAYARSIGVKPPWSK
jgi:uncharacterized damage-inducible protein DinB